jgi:hypothetical protein
MPNFARRAGTKDIIIHQSSERGRNKKKNPRLKRACGAQ